MKIIELTAKEYEELFKKGLVTEDNDDLELIPEDELYNLTGFGEKKNNKLNFNFRVLKDKINELVKEINGIRKSQ